MLFLKQYANNSLPNRRGIENCSPNELRRILSFLNEYKPIVRHMKSKCLRFIRQHRTPLHSQRSLTTGLRI
jgi:hypothetical protein